ncbi:FliH/SctL family protein [Inediibacterium massiliense]|uniref:FliH/SctL family protein n=1 Tax=Inediibacterium massiliense TaxID=1658111 RepID=UPI0018FE97EC|nr:FliH/SctL family protein [Inediibacterium massiliense]
MSKIFKSSYVILGEKKQIVSENVSKDEEQEKITLENPYEDIDYEKIHEQKMKEIELLVQEKINESQKQAEQIIKDAHEDAKKIYEQAKEDGYKKGCEEGHSNGYIKGKEESQNFIREALQIKNEMLKTKENLVKNLEKEVIGLVIQTVEKLLNDKIESSHETIIGLIKSGLNKCAYTETLTLRVSPNDYEYVSSVKEKILCLVENIDDIIIKQDATLTKGSCIIDTISGSVDASIQTQFEQVKSLFYELLESE